VFTTVLQELRAYFGKGYLLAVFIPTVVFAAANAVLALYVTIGVPRAWSEWSDLSLSAQTMLLLAALVALAFVAYTIHNLQLPIVRLFEGYWRWWPLSRLRERRRAHYRAEWDYLKYRQGVIDDELNSAPKDQQNELGFAVNELYDDWLFNYPPPGFREQVLATRLGNVLRASEIYAFARYGIDSTVLWTRLRSLLNDETAEALQDAKIAMDFMLLMTLYAFAFTGWWFPYLAVTTDDWRLVLLATIGFPLAWLCYGTAVQSAIAYGQQIRVVFDLYRRDLLTALQLKVPVEPEKERLLWTDLSYFFQRNIPLDSARAQLAMPPEKEYAVLRPADPSPPEPTGWGRILRGVGQIRQGLREAINDTEGAG
jgi:hypothetical protein